MDIYLSSDQLDLRSDVRAFLKGWPLQGAEAELPMLVVADTLDPATVFDLAAVHRAVRLPHGGWRDGDVRDRNLSWRVDFDCDLGVRVARWRRGGRRPAGATTREHEGGEREQSRTGLHAGSVDSSCRSRIRA